MRKGISPILAMPILAPLLLAGCTNTYLETKAKVRGGVYDRELQQAEQDYQNEKDKQVQIQRDQERVNDQQLSVNRDIERVEAELDALDKDLAKASSDLEQAKAENKLSREEYEKLKQELDQLRFEQQVQQNSSGDPARKQAEVNALQERKAALQKAIELLAGG